MDGQRFDELARRLATGASRRAVLKKVAAGAVGGLLAGARVRAPGVEASADKAKTKKGCPPDAVGPTCSDDFRKRCCGGKCVKPCADGVVDEDCSCFGTCCPAGETCSFDDDTCYCTSVDQFGVSPCGGVCCTPDVTACHIEPTPAGHERFECRLCQMTGPAQPGVPCCRGGGCVGTECTCHA